MNRYGNVKRVGELAEGVSAEGPPEAGVTYGTPVTIGAEPEAPAQSAPARPVSESSDR